MNFKQYVRRQGWRSWVLVATVFAGWGGMQLLRPAQPADQQEPVVTSSPARPPTTPTNTASSAPGALASVVPRPQASSPNSLLESSATQGSVARNVDDLCTGVATASAPNRDTVLADREAAVRASLQRAALAKRLVADSDGEKRAAGSLLQALESKAAICELSDCSAQDASLARHTAAALQQLAMSAAGSKNATIYGWAYAGCRTAYAEGVTSAACSQITPERWAEISPRSGWAWLAIAAEGQASNDLSRIEAMLQRVTAIDADWSNPALALQRMVSEGTVAPDAGPGGPDLTGMLPITTTVQSVFIGLIGSLNRYCAAPVDANRQQSCAVIARQLLPSVGSLAEQRVALKVGEAAGLGARELAPYQAEQQQATKLLSTNSNEFQDPQAQCLSLRRVRELTLRINRIGELAALREALGASAPGGARQR